MDLDFEIDLEDKTDLDLWDCLGRKKKLCLITEEIRYLSRAVLSLLLNS